jgi:hypothetical protein
VSHHLSVRDSEKQALPPIFPSPARTGATSAAHMLAISGLEDPEILT